MVNLIDIPEEMIRYISKFLMIEDVIHLSMSCKYLFYILPSYSIEEEDIDGSNLDASDPLTSRKHFLHFDTPPFISQIFMVKIYSKRKIPMQIIRLQLIRPDVHSNEEIIVETFDCFLRDCFARADAVKFLSIEDPIIYAIKPGDYFRLIMKRESKMFITELRINTKGLCCGPRISQRSTKTIP